MGNDRVRGVQDCLRRAVVLLEPDDARALELLFKGKNVLDRCAAEFVDGLVIVADDADIFVAPGQQRRQAVLQLVRVLIFVDHDVVEFLLVIGAHILIGFQQLHGFEDDIVKVQRVGFVQALFVFRVNLCDALHAEIAGFICAPAEGLRVLPLVLGLADERERQPRRQRLFIQIKVLQNVLHHALGIARIIDREPAGVAVQPVDFPAQDAAAGRVERHGPHVHGIVAQQRLQSGFQLVGRLVRKRDGKDRPRRGRAQRAKPLGLHLHGGIARLQIGLEVCNVLFRYEIRNLFRVRALAEGDEVRDAVDKYSCLAASGAGQQKKRPLRRHDAFALHIVERREPGSDHCAARGQKSGFKCRIHSFTFSKTMVILPHFSPFVDIKKTFEAAAALSFRSG